MISKFATHIFHERVQMLKMNVKKEKKANGDPNTIKHIVIHNGFKFSKNSNNKKSSSYWCA